jgi:hypothetical protein
MSLRTAAALVLLCLLAALPGCRTLIEKGYPTVEGEVTGLPLEAPVEVLRDTWSIPRL